MTLTPVHQRPAPRQWPARATQIIDVARSVLEAEGPQAVTMRRLAEELGIRAPSLYKHFPSKAAVEAVLIEMSLTESADQMHAAVAKPGKDGPVAALAKAYRRSGVAHPNLYRLVTSSRFDRSQLTPGLEDWAGEVFYLATGDAYVAQALWAFLHGMMILEIDGRFLPGSDLRRTWAAGTTAFTG